MPLLVLFKKYTGMLWSDRHICVLGVSGEPLKASRVIICCGRAVTWAAIRAAEIPVKELTKHFTELKSAGRNGGTLDRVPRFFYFTFATRRRDARIPQRDASGSESVRLRCVCGHMGTMLVWKLCRSFT